MSKFKYQKPTTEDIDKRANQSGGNYKSFIKSDYKFFKPAKGDNVIRILPPTWLGPEARHPHHGLEIFVHSFIGPDKATVLCLQQMRASACPICEEMRQAEKRGANDETINALRPKKRVLVWLLDRTQEEPKQTPLLWAMPWKEDREIAARMKDRQTGELFFPADPEEGYDLSFEKKGEMRSTEYIGWEVSRRSTSVAERHLDYICEHTLQKVLNWYTYAEVLAIFEGTAPAEEPKPEAAAARTRPRMEPELSPGDIEATVQERLAKDDGVSPPWEEPPPRQERAQETAAPAKDVPGKPEPGPDRRSRAEKLREAYNRSTAT